MVVKKPHEGPKTKEEFDELSRMAEVSAKVIRKVIPFYLETVNEEIKKAKAGHIVIKDIPNFIFGTASAIPSVILDELESCGIFKELEEEGYKEALMKGYISKLVMLLASQQGKGKLV